MTRTTDAWNTRQGLIFDTWDRDFVDEVTDQLEAGEPAQIYDYGIRGGVVIRPSDLDPRLPTMRSVNRILKDHGIRPRRRPRGAR
jgi:hypothetical protein